MNDTDKEYGSKQKQPPGFKPHEAQPGGGNAATTGHDRGVSTGDTGPVDTTKPGEVPAPEAPNIDPAIGKDRIDAAVGEFYSTLLQEPVPDVMLQLLNELERKERRDD